MHKKFIIENHQDSQTFAILVIKETRLKEGYIELGYLSYFQVDNDGFVSEWDISSDYLSDNKAQLEISADLIKKAEDICKEHTVKLWGY